MTNRVPAATWPGSAPRGADGDHYVVNGAKTLFPTGRPETCSSSPCAPHPIGTRACRCWSSTQTRRVSAAAEPGEDRSARPGHQRAQLHRHEVPVENLFGEEGRGFYQLMNNLLRNGCRWPSARWRRRGGIGRNPRLRQAAQTRWLPISGLQNTHSGLLSCPPNSTSRVPISTTAFAEHLTGALEPRPGPRAEMVDHELQVRTADRLPASCMAIRVHAGIPGVARVRRRRIQTSTAENDRDHEDHLAKDLGI